MNDTTDATAILAPIWRRKWLILLVAVLAGVGSYFHYKAEPKIFQSSTELYLLAGNEEQQAEKGTGGGKSKLNGGSQAQLITTVVRERVRHNLRHHHTTVSQQALKGKIRAKASEKSAFITITTEARSGEASALLANSVARNYIQRQHGQFTRGLRRTIAIDRRQLRRVETPHAIGHGKNSGATGLSATDELQAANLNSKISQLEQQLNVKAVEQINPARPKAARLLQPKPRKNAEFGFIVGLILSSIAAFVLSRINRRLRTVRDVEASLGMTVLTVIPNVKNPILERDGAPATARALIEPLRKLDVTLRLPNAGNGRTPAVPRSVLFLSLESSEGASTMVAGLALIEREAGERTAIVEANLRRPAQARLLRLEGTRGLLDVLAGSVPLSAVMQAVRAAKPAATAGSEAAADAEQQGAVATALAQNEGTVSVLSASSGAPNPQALLASDAMRQALVTAAEENDHVLIDAPPVLEVSDVIPLLSQVDGIVVVVRLAHARDASARRLRQLLERTPSAPVIGVVANCASRKEVERYGSAGAVRRRLFKL